MNARKDIPLDQGWSFMERGITKLKNLLEGKPGAENFSGEEYMMLYTTIYNMCTQKPPHDYSQQLYERYRDAFRDYIRDTVLPALRAKYGEFMLLELVRRWENHLVMVRWLSRFFNYLDRYYICRHSLSSLKDVGRICFRDLVFAELKGSTREAVIAMIDREREGEQIDRTLLKNVVGIFVEMGMGNMATYEAEFEAAILEDTAAYYRVKAAKWMEEDSCPTVMLKAEECLKREKERVGHYLHASSEEKLLKTVEHEVLATYEAQLLDKEHSGCRALLRDGKMDDLARMYRLFTRIPKGLEPVADIFKAYVQNEGLALVRQAEDAAAQKKDEGAGGKEKKEEGDAEGGKEKGKEKEKEKEKDGEGGGGGGGEQLFVRKVIDLHDKFLGYVGGCFANASLFHKALKEAFEAFCNKNVAGSSTAELLASFCDNLLKKGGSEKLSDEGIEETLDKVVKLLAYISDKDLFAEFYRKKLAHRLLFNKSSSEDHERSILSKLKQQCGTQFTSKMEGMVQDLTLGRENNARFKDYLKDNPELAPGVDFSVTVLTTGNWPSYKVTDMNLPVEMVRCVELFKEYYDTRSKHRKLSWTFSLGTCNVKANFEPRSMELVVATFQAAVLLLFNDNEKLSYEDIKKQLNLGDEDLVRVLHSLSCAKYKILLKEPAERVVRHTDKFAFNAKFTDKMRRIKVCTHRSPLTVHDASTVPLYSVQC
eukprot:jgi/Mesvir1/22833/Mv20093-RA.1